MKYKYLILIGTSLFSIASLKAQDTLATHLTYDLTAETAVGTGDYTAFQLTTNRHHVLGTRSNTAYLRGAVSIEHPFTEKLKLSATLDGIASIHADHKAYLQQCFVNLTYRSFFVEVGSREHKQVVRDDLLSSGSFVKGTNAKPIPQIHLGTNDFWTVPYTKEWLQINFDFGYGKFLDSGYREDRYREASSANRMYTTGAYYHQKHLYFRTNPEKRFFAMIGAEHVAQFGGTNYSRVNGELIEKSKPANLKAFWNVILPLGDSNYYNDEAPEDWVYGNHVGILTAQLGWNINKEHQLQVYLDDIFEDGSGIRKSNGWDGLWGLQYKNRASGRQYVRGAVFEYFQSTNQCGPLHWDSGDRPEPIRSQITYNKNGYTGFSDNRIKAWHLGVNGELTGHLSYLVKGSYREGWGTYKQPLPERHHSFDAMLQGIYTTGAWQFAAVYAFDKGNIYGDCSTFNIKIGYHGKIL